jgi:hypothetical protein
MSSAVSAMREASSWEASSALMVAAMSFVDTEPYLLGPATVAPAVVAASLASTGGGGLWSKDLPGPSTPVVGSFGDVGDDDDDDDGGSCAAIGER